MKALNTMKFVSNTTAELTEYIQNINDAKTYEEAANIGRLALGYVNCLVTFLNTMICKENNDFTGEYDDVLNAWMCAIYQACANKAIDTKQSEDKIWKILMKRDEYIRV